MRSKIVMITIKEMRALMVCLILLTVHVVTSYAQTHLKVIILAGQSNMVGNGGNDQLPPELQQEQTNVKIYCSGTFDNSVLNKWLFVKPGMGSLVPGKSPSPAFGCEVPFAKRISTLFPNDNIAIIKYAHSGTDLATQWRPPSSGGTTGPLYDGLIATVNTALNSLGNGFTYEIAGMCWMQGESDGETNGAANAYQTNLTNFIGDVRATLGYANLPFIIAKIGTNATKIPYHQAVRQAEDNVATTVHHTAIFDTKDYATSDGLHYYSPGYIQLGNGFANALQPLFISGIAEEQTPYKEISLIPGTIEAENYDNGGQNVAYFDTDASNNGGAYRNDRVDIQICNEGGFNTGWTFDSEWMEYTVNVATTGKYKVGFRVATPNQNCKFHLEFDGENKTGVVSINPTGDYQTWTTVEKEITLTAGNHIMRYYVDAASGGVNINKFEFTSAGAPLLGTGTGLTGNYFNGMNFETSVLTHEDATINFNWEAGSPNANINNDGFSIRWTGAIEPLYSEEYTFYINSDNGRRLWINNQLVIDKWISDWGTEYSGKITLEGGTKYEFKMEYFEENGGANVKLEWQSASQPRAVVNTSQLYPNSLVTAANSYSEILKNIQIYPNPVAGNSFSINLSEMKESTTLNIYDGTGNLIYSQLLDSENHQVPTPEKAGLYMLSVQGSNFNYTGKLVVSE